MKNNIDRFWDAEALKEKMETLQKAQGELASQIINQGVELQKKQFLLFSNIFQNQVVFGKTIWTNALDIINDNNFYKEKSTKHDN